MQLHYITLRHTTLIIVKYGTLHYNCSYNYTTSHYTALQYTTLQYTTPHYITLLH